MESDNVTESLAEVLSAIAHELRHDVSAILHQVELMKLDGLDEATRRRSMTALEASTEWLVRFTDELSELGRIARGEVRPERQPVGVAELLAAWYDQDSAFELELPGSPVTTDPLIVNHIIGTVISEYRAMGVDGGDTVPTVAVQVNEPFVDLVFGATGSPAHAGPADPSGHLMTLHDGLALFVAHKSAELIGARFASFGGEDPATYALRLPAAPVPSDHDVVPSLMDELVPLAPSSATDPNDRDASDRVWPQADQQPTWSLDERSISPADAELHQLALDLLRAEQLERERMAKLLHDDIQQSLFGARLRLGLLQEGVAKDGLAGLDGHLAEADRYIADSIVKTRQLCTELAPTSLDDDLSDAIASLVAQVLETRDLDVEVRTGAPVVVTDRTIRLAVHQTVRELLFNAVKHTGVSKVRLDIGVRGDEIDIEVSDAPLGSEPEEVFADPMSDGRALATLHQRLRLVGGSMRLESDSNDGVRARIRIPSGTGYGARP